MIDYNAIAAFTGLGTAIIAVCALWLESRRHRFSTSLSLMLRLEEEFSTRRMYKNRKLAAYAFNNGRIREAANEIDEIIDFFEGIAFFVEKGAIDKESVWTCFFSYIYRFYHYAYGYINEERERDPTLWISFLDLYKKLYRIEQDNRNRNKRLKRIHIKNPKANLKQKDLQQFLNEEMKLDIDLDDE
ncbi:MAG: hypothetical protein PHV06_03220 [bacterium]|nr:hypothetical protein [bacterium]